MKQFLMQPRFVVTIALTGALGVGAASCADDSVGLPEEAYRQTPGAFAAQSDSGGVVSTGQPSDRCPKATSCLRFLTQRAFDCLVVVPCEGDWGFNGRFGFALDGTAPFSPPHVGQVTFPAGFAGGNAPGQTWSGSLGHRVLHVTAWIRFSPNFQGHSTGTNKVFHAFINGVNRLFFYASGSGLTPAIGLQQIAAPFDNGSGQPSTFVNLLPNTEPGARMLRGQWHRLDLVLTGNTPGVANGAVMTFLDGRKVSQYVGIMFAPQGGDGRWASFTWSPTWGGVGDVVSQDMYMQLDHILINGKN